MLHIYFNDALTGIAQHLHKLQVHHYRTSPSECGDVVVLEGMATWTGIPSEGLKARVLERTLLCGEAKQNILLSPRVTAFANGLVAGSTKSRSAVSREPIRILNPFVHS